MSYLSQLHKQMIKHMSLEEVRTLCFVLNLNHEDFPEAGRTALTRALLVNIAQNNRLPELLHALKEEKPNQPWLELPLDFEYQSDSFLQADNQQILLTNSQHIAGHQNTIIGERGAKVEQVGRDLVTGDVHYHHYTNPNPQTEDEKRVRRILLDKVQAFWIDGVLNKSLHHVARLELGVEWQHEQVERPWTFTIAQTGFNDDQPPSPADSILTVAKSLGGSLLILGAPGSGKSTSLQELARDLILDARLDASLQIPIIFNLSSWAAKRKPLKEWLLDELTDASMYGLSRQFAAEWLAKEPFILLLDGLDEVNEQYRTACVTAINQFKAGHGQTPLIVCSRIKDYEALAEKLKLGGAVMIQPLTRAQVGDYLASAGERLAAVAEALQTDDILWELAETPLTLSIMTLAYEGVKKGEVGRGSTIAEQRQHLFATYILRMFKRKQSPATYTQDNALHWLSYLAYQLQKHQQTTFSIENIQPDWLLTQKQQTKYRWLTRLFVGLVVGLGSGLVVGLGGGLVAGLGSGVLVGLDSGLEQVKPIEKLSWDWKKAKEGLVFGLLVGLGSGLVGGLVVSSLVSNPVIGLVVGLGSGLLVGLGRGLPNGLVPERISTKTKTNEGIHQSWRNYLIAIFVFGLVVGFVFGLVNGLTGGLVFGLIFGLIFGLEKGGKAVFKHYVLRYLLSYYSYLPTRKNLVPFLDDMANRILLRRVGGSWIFIHRMLLEQLAAGWEEHGDLGDSKN